MAALPFGSFTARPIQRDGWKSATSARVFRSVRRRTLHPLDNDDRSRPACAFQPQPELLTKRAFERRQVRVDRLPGTVHTEYRRPLRTVVHVETPLTRQRRWSRLRTVLAR